MSTLPPHSVSDSDLNAFADRQLAPERAAAVEAALARDPELAARAAEYPRAKRVVARRPRPCAGRTDSRAAARGGGARGVRRGRRRAALGDARARGGGNARPRRRARLVRPRCDDRARRHADHVRALRRVRACAVRGRRAAAGRSLGRRGKEPRDVAHEAARIQGASTGPERSRLRARRRPAGGRQRIPHCALHVRECRQGAAVAAGAQADGARSHARRARWRHGVPLRRSKTASASSTGSTTTAATRFPARSTVRSSSRSRTSSTASWPRSRRPARSSGAAPCGSGSQGSATWNAR